MLSASIVFYLKAKVLICAASAPDHHEGNYLRGWACILPDENTAAVWALVPASKAVQVVTIISTKWDSNCYKNEPEFGQDSIQWRQS